MDRPRRLRGSREVTGAAAALCLALMADPPPAAAPGQRLERRVLLKQGRLLLWGGGGWLARGDYYDIPSLALGATWWPSERNGVEVVVERFFPRLSDSAREVYRLIGLAPDAQPPTTFLGAGWRHALTFGKVAVGQGAAHFDLLATARLGLLRSDAGTSPAGALGPGLVVRLSSGWAALLDIHLTASGEERLHASVSWGVLSSLSLGWWW